MARLFTNRIRIHDITRHDADLKSHFRWETLGAVMYKLGGILFVVGSILFFPSFSAYSWLGQIVFFAGSLCYLTINCHDTYDTHRYWASQAQSKEKWLEYSATYIYLLGTLMYVAGRVATFIDSQYQALSSTLFIVGSLLFVVGATINIINIRKNQLTAYCPTDEPNSNNLHRRKCAFRCWLSPFAMARGNYGVFTFAGQFYLMAVFNR